MKKTSLENQIKNELKLMTLREKIGQCLMIEPVFCVDSLNREITDENEKYLGITDPKFLNKLINEYHIGFLLFGGITRLGNDYMIDWAEHIKKINEFANKSNAVPMMYGVDAIHGMNFVKGTTIYSHNLGLTSTWSPKLAKDYMNLVGEDLSSIGMSCNFAPTIDVARDQRWGRVYESLGEDPYLASRFSEALVEGLQNVGDVAGCAKHFIGYGDSNNGMDRTPADISERSLKEIHLPPFEAAINSGVKAIMINGGDLNGTPMPASKKMLTKVLRDELGFRGITMSDWEDVYRLEDRHHIVTSREEAIAKAFNAGLDMNMVVADLKAVDMMEKLVHSNKISMERLDEAVSNILRVKLSLGLFENKEIDLDKVKNNGNGFENRKLAKKIAEESITLLKNENNILPLSKDITSILVTGKSANSKRHMCGGWTLNWASANEEDLDFPTVLDVLHKKYGETTKIIYVEDLEGLGKLDIDKENFDVVLSFVGEEPHSEWLGDSFTIKIEKDEFELLQAAQATNIPTVMISLIGRPQKITWASNNISAIVWGYLPGSEGAEPIVDILFGDINPSGKTPITFPNSGNQIPIVYNARRYVSNEIITKYEPLYPFGYGLSYTTFNYSNLVLPKSVDLGKGITVSVDVTNTGKVTGKEVVMVYLTDVYASVTRPIKSLKQFDKIELHPGETKTVELYLSPLELSLYNEDLELEEEAREIEVIINTEKARFKLG